MVDAIIIFAASKLHIVIVLGGMLFLAFLPAKRRVVLASKALIALPSAFILGRTADLFISSPRPFVVENIEPLISHISNNGFPSEHTLLVATISALVYTEHRAAGIVLGVLALCVGIARVVANVHHGIDIVGSIVIASIAVTCAHYIVSLMRSRLVD